MNVASRNDIPALQMLDIVISRICVLRSAIFAADGAYARLTDQWENLLKFKLKLFSKGFSEYGIVRLLPAPSYILNCTCKFSVCDNCRFGIVMVNITWSLSEFFEGPKVFVQEKSL